jgi:hypothetical protein
MNITSEESALLELLGVKIKVKEVKEHIKSFKLIRGVTKCKLCGTVSIQLIQMVSTPDGAWIKEKELSVNDTKDISVACEEYETEIRTCKFCKYTLSFKEKGELIDLIISLYNPLLSRQEVWKMVRKLKEAGEEKETENE